MADPAPQDLLPAEDDGVLDPADSLEDDDLDEDPLERGIITADRYRGATGYDTTAREAAAGESLDRFLAEAEPDTPGPDVDDRWPERPGTARRAAGGGDGRIRPRTSARMVARPRRGGSGPRNR